MNLVRNANPDIVIGEEKNRTALQTVLHHLWKDKILWVMILPGLVYYIIFHYLPLYGVIVAFQNYSPFRGMLGGPWVGFRWFKEFFDSIFFERVMVNTILLNVYRIIFFFPAPIILALMINEIQHNKFKRLAQSISYMPHFVSQVVIVGMVVNFLSPSSGIINHIIKAIGLQPIHFMVKAEWFRTIYVSSEIWQEVGWCSIIYLAALSNIDPQLYEAAKVDGAGRLRQIWHITLPGITITIIILLLLNMGKMLTIGYQKIILLYNPSIYETADVINTYVYRRGILSGDYSFATAVGLFQSSINFILLVIFNKISRRVNEVSLW